jgi:hypothetical protein
MALAQTGPLTTALEAVATAVGAGIVIFSFAAGIWGLAVGLSKGDIENRALRGGYFGGALGAAIVAADVVMRYRH